MGSVENAVCSLEGVGFEVCRGSYLLAIDDKHMMKRRLESNENGRLNFAGLVRTMDDRVFIVYHVSSLINISGT